ncbi:MAG: hypothetical protein AAFP86_23075, partial [Planctomycetota bacterium]
GARTVVGGFTAAVRDGQVVVQPILDRYERGVEIPVRFGVDEASIGSFPFPLPGETDQGFRIDVPVGFQIDSGELETFGAAVKAALDEGVLEFGQDGSIESVASELLAGFNGLGEGLGAEVDRLFFAGPILEFTNAAGEAQSAYADFSATVVDGVTTLTPRLEGLNVGIEQARNALSEPINIPLVQASSDGIAILDRLVTGTQEAAAALGVAAVSQEDYAAAVERGAIALGASTQATADELRQSARLAVLRAETLTGLDREIALLGARQQAEELAVAARVISGRQSAESAREELALIREIAAAREADARAAAASNAGPDRGGLPVSAQAIEAVRGGL